MIRFVLSVISVNLYNDQTRCFVDRMGKYFSSLLSHTIKPRLPGMMWPPGIKFYICSKTSALIQVLTALSQIVCRVEHECVSLLQLH